MKKIISMILVVASLTAMPAYARYSDVDETEEAINTIAGLGLIEGYADGTFLPENNMTRAEFASVVANIYNYGTEDNSLDEWKQSFFKDVEEELKLIEIEDVVSIQEVYVDVTDTDEYYDDIMLATQHGLMVGIGNEMFDPEGSMTFEQAVKVVVSMLGYSYEAQVSGGYPNGYISVAQRLGMLKGVETSGYITRADAAQLLFNSLEIDLMQLKISGQSGSGFTTIEGENVLTMFLNIQKQTGRITDDGFTTFTDKSRVGENYIDINGIKLFVDEEHDYAREYLGREVKVYYSQAENDLVYICPTNRDTIIEINASEFVSYDGSTIEYISANGTKNKTARVNIAASVIKNGTAISSFDESIFDFNYGTITLITPRGENSADLILIKEYANFNIDFADSTNEKIFSKASVLGESVDLSTDDKRVKIYNSNGEATDFNSLTMGMVTSICLGDNLVEVYISQKTVENVLVSAIHYNDSDEMVVSSGDTEYILSKDYIDANPEAELPKLNATYTFYFDILGNIVMFTKTASENEVGFITKVIKLDESEAEKECLMLTYYDLTAAKLEKVYLPDVFTLIYEDENSKTISKRVNDSKKLNLAFEIISNYITKNGERVGGLCRYSIDENNDITKLELAAMQKSENNEEDRLVRIQLDESSYNGNVYCSGNIGGKVIINNETKVLACNYASESFDTDGGFSVGTRTFFTDNEIMDNVMVYTSKKDSSVAEYVIYTKDVTQAISTKLPHTVGIVRGIYQSIDADDMPVQILTMDASNMEYTVVDDALEEGNVKNVQGDNAYVDANGVSHYFKVEIGDIIRYGLDQDGNINNVQLMFDENADYSGGFTIDGNVYYNFNNVQGALAGCIDHWEDALYTYSNPYSVSYVDSNGTYSFSTYGYAWMTYSNEAMRVMLGYALKGDSDYIITTTQPLEVSSYDETKTGYVTNTWSGTTATLIDLQNKEPKISEINLSQIKTYETAGRNCDRVLITSRIGNPSNILVIRGHLK